jgi:hypothetical protein
VDGNHPDVVARANQPCHFGYWKNGDTVTLNRGAGVTMRVRNNNVIGQLREYSATEERKTRTMTGDKLIPGKFVAPHGACFGQKGHILVVEWVEVGRITKLRCV